MQDCTAAAAAAQKPAHPVRPSVHTSFAPCLPFACAALPTEHIGTKTAVQIRSHAQKFFNKLEKKKEAGQLENAGVCVWAGDEDFFEQSGLDKQHTCGSAVPSRADES